MPPKRKGKKKKKSKGKKGKPQMNPPPLHNLTTLYNLLQERLEFLSKMRIQARKKRLEAWFMTREMSDAKSDAQIYHDFLDDNINELHEIIQKIMDEIEKERAAIQKEIDRLLGELNKRHEQIMKRTLEIEEHLARIKAELLQFEPLMAKLAKMLLRLEQLAKEIAAAELEADIKTRHLKNQFLCERGKLHNHMEKQLYDLIQNCRSYIMPILWHHMKRMGFMNSCVRWRLAKADAKNIRLGEQREELMLKRKMLTIEKNYMGVEWAFFKLSEIQVKQKQIQKDLRNRKEHTASSEEVVAELATAFNIYLKKRLTAYQEAKRRDQRNKRLKKSETGKSLMAKKSKRGVTIVELPGEDDDDFDEEWEDVGEGDGIPWDPDQQIPGKKHRKHRKKPKYHSGSTAGLGDDDYDADRGDRDSNSSGDASNTSVQDDDEGAGYETEGSEEEEGENWGKLTTVVNAVQSQQSAISTTGQANNNPNSQSPSAVKLRSSRSLANKN